MRALLSRFLRIAFWCWLPVFVCFCVASVAFAIHGEVVSFQSHNTWLAFAYGTLFAGVLAIPPALFFAALISAAVFRRSAFSVGAAPPSRAQPHSSDSFS